MTPVELITIILGLAIIFKGLAILLAQAKLQIWIDKNYTKHTDLKWICITLGIIILYYAVQNVPIFNVLSIIFGISVIIGGVLFNFPKEMKQISKDAIKIKGIKLFAIIAIIAGLSILYLTLVF